MSGRVLGRRLLAVAAALVCALLLAWLRYGSWEVFARSIDFNQSSFEDFTGPYYRTGRSLLESGRPGPGFYYSPAFALFLSWLVRWQGEASVWSWLALQLAALALVLGATLALARITRPLPCFAASLLVLLSFPLVHNFHWGQVSTPLLALELLALSAWIGERRRLAGALLALPASIKFYPALFLLPAVFAGDLRQLRAALLVGLLLLLVVPAAALGPQATLEFYRAVARGLASAQAPGGLWAGAANEQFLPSVLERLGGEHHGAAARLCGWGLALALAFHHLRWLARMPLGASEGRLAAYLLLFATIPLLIAPAWPHYLVALPVCQLVLLARLASPARGARSLAALLALGGSVVLASMPFFHAWPGPASYNAAGMLAWSNLLTLPALYLWCSRVAHASALAGDGDPAQAAGRR